MQIFAKGMNIVLLAVLALSAGCATFVPSRRLDMGPFGENTTIMVNDIQHNLLTKKPIYLKPYLQGPDLAEFRKQWADMQKILRGIVLYSTQVVALSRSKLTGPEKAKALARYIEIVMVPVIENKSPDIPMTRVELDTVLESIRAKDTLLSALGAAQPLVDAITNFSTSTFAKLNELAQRVVQETQERIDLNSALVLENAAGLKALQGRSIKSYSLLYEHRMGDPKALDSLLKNDPELKQYVKPGNSLDARGLESMEKDLMARLQNISLLSEHIRPQLDQYRAETRELDDLARASEETFRKAGITMLVWARSHGNLAAGIEVPPPVNMASVLAEAATGAAKKVLTLH